MALIGSTLNILHCVASPYGIVCYYNLVKLGQIGGFSLSFHTGSVVWHSRSEYYKTREGRSKDFNSSPLFNVIQYVVNFTTNYRLNISNKTFGELTSVSFGGIGETNTAVVCCEQTLGQH
jgi:hypothetical protein